MLRPESHVHTSPEYWLGVVTTIFAPTTTVCAPTGTTQPTRISAVTNTPTVFMISPSARIGTLIAPPVEGDTREVPARSTRKDTPRPGGRESTFISCARTSV